MSFRPVLNSNGDTLGAPAWGMWRQLHPHRFTQTGAVLSVFQQNQKFEEKHVPGFAAVQKSQSLWEKESHGTFNPPHQVVLPQLSRSGQDAGSPGSQGCWSRTCESHFGSAGRTSEVNGTRHDANSWCSAQVSSQTTEREQVSHEFPLRMLRPHYRFFSLSTNKMWLILPGSITWYWLKILYGRV